MGVAAKLGLVLAMVALVLGAQLFERELAARRRVRASDAAKRPPVLSLLEPLADAPLPQVPRGAPAAGSGPAAATADAAGERVYIVQPGDNLAKIARKTLGREGAWTAIYERNRGAIPNPTRLQVGASLRIPAAAATPEPARQLTTGSRPR